MNWKILLVGPVLALSIASWVVLAMVDPVLIAIYFALAVSAIVQVERDVARESCAPARVVRR